MTLKFEHIDKSFQGGKKILDDLNFQLPLGAFSGLLGPSGCGKTTLLRILAGLDVADRGKISLNEEVLVDMNRNFYLKPEKRNIGMVFQSYAVWPHMDVFENIAFPLRIRRRPQLEVKTEVDKILKAVRLDGLEKRMPYELSGGQQQRVALARALVQRPKLLLLDEPLSNLDAALRENMRQELRDIQKFFGLTAVIVTHDWADARGLCDHLVVLNEGHIEQEGNPDAILANPSSSFVRQLTKVHA